VPGAQLCVRCRELSAVHRVDQRQSIRIVEPSNDWPRRIVRHFATSLRGRSNLSRGARGYCPTVGCAIIGAAGQRD